MSLFSKTILPVLAISVCAAAIMPGAAQAADAKESYCSLIRETADGKFKTELKFGWSLLRAQKDEGVIAFDDDVSGISCLREPLIVQEPDMESLNQGKILYFSAPSNPMTIVRYEMKDGKIIWEASSGAVNKGQKKAIDKAVSALNANLK